MQANFEEGHLKFIDKMMRSKKLAHEVKYHLDQIDHYYWNLSESDFLLNLVERTLRYESIFSEGLILFEEKLIYVNRITETSM